MPLFNVLNHCDWIMSCLAEVGLRELVQTRSLRARYLVTEREVASYGDDSLLSCLNFRGLTYERISQSACA